MCVYKRAQRRSEDPAFELPLGAQSLQVLDAYFQVGAGGATGKVA